MKFFAQLRNFISIFFSNCFCRRLQLVLLLRVAYLNADGLFFFCAVVIETLVNRGRHIDAVHFVDAFQLFESYPPVSLLKAYLEASKAPQVNNGDPNAAGSLVSFPCVLRTSCAFYSKV